MSVQKQQKPKKQITVAQLKEDLINGLNRKGIAAKYDISVSAVNKIFKHPELASLRPKGSSDVELVDSSGSVYSPAMLVAKAEAANVNSPATEETASASPAAEQAQQAAQEAQVSENAGI